jgi:hypothetical protein
MQRIHRSWRQQQSANLQTAASGMSAAATTLSANSSAAATAATALFLGPTAALHAQNVTVTA